MAALELVVFSPLTVRHHFLIAAVPVAAGAAVALREITPVRVELFAEVHATVGISFAWLSVAKKKPVSVNVAISKIKRLNTKLPLIASL